MAGDGMWLYIVVLEVVGKKGLKNLCMHTALISLWGMFCQQWHVKPFNHSIYAPCNLHFSLTYRGNSQTRIVC